MKTLKVAIVPLEQPGHINPTLRLYRELTARGHEVRYIASAEHSTLFRERNLPVTFAKERTQASLTQVSFDLDGAFVPDAVAVDNFLCDVAMVAWSRGVPVIQLAPLFPHRYDASVPPLDTDLMPPTDDRGRAQVEAAWAAAHHRHRTEVQVVGGVATGLSNVEYLRGVASAVGFPSAWIEERSSLHPTLRLPELALNAAFLDFQRPTPPSDLFYAGSCVDLSRPEPSEPVTIPSDRPLVYCSFGSQVHRYACLREALAVVVEVAQRLPDVHFVIATGIEFAVPAPANASLVRRVPQLQLLRHAALMITHGGINGFSEALLLGVPLIVIPFDGDQPGNAARAVYHGVGHALAPVGLTAAALAEKVKTALGDAALARRVRQVSGRLSETYASDSAAEGFARCLELTPRRAQG